ncbi:hypothetical protein [Bacillus mycoides]|uniref:hypothetical protein n=1 Tax=Bacillus mycoides TaxID=1405 RepID=UPI003A7FF795
MFIRTIDTITEGLQEAEKQIKLLEGSDNAVEEKTNKGRLAAYQEISEFYNRGGVRETRKQVSKWLLVAIDWERTVSKIMTTEDLAFFKGRKAVFVEINTELANRGIAG